MAKQVPLDPRSREKILSAYERAKKHDPNLSGPDFMWSVPEMRSRFKDKTTAGAYLRVLRQGKRTGGEIYAEASTGKEKGLYQISFKVAGQDRFVSQNLSVANAQSSFDIAAIEAEMRTPKNSTHLQKLIEKFQSRYGFGGDELSPDRFKIRRVENQRRRPYRMAI